MNSTHADANTEDLEEIQEFESQPSDIERIEADIERLKPLARADRLAKIAQVENYWRGSEEQLQAALDELERAKQREVDELERRDALEFAGKVKRLLTAIAQYNEQRGTRVKLNAEIARFPEHIQIASEKPAEADDVNFSHVDPHIHKRLQQNLVDVKALRELKYRLNWTRPKNDEINRLIDEEPALELALPPELRANNVPE